MENINCTLENELFVVLKTAVEKIDLQVNAVRRSQVELRESIDDVSDELQRISENQPVDINLDPYIRKLINTKRHVVLVSNIVQNVQDRLIRLQKSVEAETLKKQSLIQAQTALLDVSKQPTQT